MPTKDSSLQVYDDAPDRPWDEPGVYLVADGIYRMPLPIPADGLRAVNAYVVRDGASLTVVDPGPGVDEAHEALVRGLAALDAGPGDVDDLLITHVHYDHYTQAVALRERHPLRIWLGRGEEPSLRVLHDTTDDLADQAAQLHRYGDAELARWAASRRADGPIDALLRHGPDRWIEDEQTLPGTDGLQALHTPGHTRGHVVFRDEPRGLLFAGDHVLPSITPSIGFEAAVADRPLADYLRSLRRVQALPDTRLLPAHGPVTGSVHARIDELLRHHDDRLAAAVDAVGGGAATALEVAGVLRWTRRERRLDELDRFNRMLAVIETGYHLDVLADRGVLRVQEPDGVAHYAVA